MMNEGGSAPSRVKIVALCIEVERSESEGDDVLVKD